MEATAHLVIESIIGCRDYVQRQIQVLEAEREIRDVKRSWIQSGVIFLLLLAIVVELALRLK
jgi:hypothetical protein